MATTRCWRPRDRSAPLRFELWSSCFWALYGLSEPLGSCSRGILRLHTIDNSDSLFLQPRRARKSWDGAHVASLGTGRCSPCLHSFDAASNVSVLAVRGTASLVDSRLFVRPTPRPERRRAPKSRRLGQSLGERCHQPYISVSLLKKPLTLKRLGCDPVEQIRIHLWAHRLHQVAR